MATYQLLSTAPSAEQVLQCYAAGFGWQRSKRVGGDLAKKDSPALERLAESDRSPATEEIAASQPQGQRDAACRRAERLSFWNRKSPRFGRLPTLSQPRRN